MDQKYQVINNPCEHRDYMTKTVIRNESDYKSQCGCRKADELIHRFGVIDVVSLYPIARPEESELVFRIVVGKTLDGYKIVESIEYCPYCGNRFDGLVRK